MTNFTMNGRDFTTHSGLYRVWVPLHPDGKSPLLSIWIDPSRRAFESCCEAKDTSVPRIHRRESATEADAEDANSVFPADRYARSEKRRAK
jgi:hypothetical protein